MSIIYDGSLYYKSKHLPPRNDKRGYSDHLINFVQCAKLSITYKCVFYVFLVIE